MKIKHALYAILFVNIFTALFVCAQEISPPDERGYRLMEKCCLIRRAAWISDRESGSVGGAGKTVWRGKVIKDAEKILRASLPELTDDLYLDYSRTGNRDHCQEVIFKRQDRASLLTLAEFLKIAGFCRALKK